MPLFGKKTAKAKDPVCGMQVDPASARWTSVYEGTTYYFCNPGCKDAFDSGPSAFVGGSTSGSAHHA